MSAVLVTLGYAWIGVVALLVMVLLVEVVAGCRIEAPRDGAATRVVPSYVVLMPAHDEAGTIESTIAAVRPQLPPSARLLVVADNCSDATAAQARRAGAEVVERRHAALRGKGHALAYGLEQLRSAPPDVVVVLDADCIPAPGALDLIAARAAELHRPVQALYLMSAPPGSSLALRLAAFAWALKNELRPRGLHRLGLPCQLMGSGMAFPWDGVEHVQLASGHLTEDLQLGVQLAGAGSAPCFAPQARVDSWFPESRAALQSQRRRWEHGHLSMILAGVPRLLRDLPRGGGTNALALALDLCVPPLALLAAMLAVSCALAVVMAAFGGAGWLPVVLAASSLLAYAAAVGMAWWQVGRRWVTFLELASALDYAARKLPLYAAFILRRQREWVRTNRER